jgi:hypothetical protein
LLSLLFFLVLSVILRIWCYNVTLQLKDNIECIHLICALGIVAHISRQINKSIIIMYIYHDITSRSS